MVSSDVVAHLKILLNSKAFSIDSHISYDIENKKKYMHHGDFSYN